MAFNTKIQQANMVNVMQTNESNITINPYYYKENKFGEDIVKAQINIIDSQLVVVASTNKKIIHLPIFCLLNKMYEMK